MNLMMNKLEFTMIKKILLNWLKNDINKLTTDAFNKGKTSQKLIDTQRRAEFSRIESDEMLGKPVIILVNEWTNPVVGELVGCHYKDENSYAPLYEVYNYLTNENSFSLSKPMAFSVQKLHALGKMNPDEIVALFYEGKDRFYTYRKNREENFYTSFDDWMEKLSANGFFEKFGEFLENEETMAENSWKTTVEV